MAFPHQTRPMNSRPIGKIGAHARQLRLVDTLDRTAHRPRLRADTRILRSEIANEDDFAQPAYAVST
ncbi:MAG: hypothetical protein LH471_06190, partial [Salinibacterium sp.]|nr:hypothetical protein [Salinibacterium sp.]